MLLLIAILPVVLLGVFIYKKDKNKEPKKLLIKLFIGGILSCFLTLLISGILEVFIPLLGADDSSLNMIELFIYVFIGIALVEEFSKFLIVYSIAHNDEAFDEIYDAIVYCVFVSLGFAAFENILYVYSNGFSTGVMRAILSVPGHACFGVFMGYYLGLAKIAGVNKNEKLRKKNLLLSLFVPTILHGIFDYCLYTEMVIFFVIFIVFIILLYIHSIKKVKKLSSVTTRFIKKNSYCVKCGNLITTKYCPNCGNKNEYL